MPITSSAPIKRALVQHLRASAPLTTALVGGIHEGFAPQKAKYPVLTYSMVVDPYAFTWGSVLHTAIFDVFVFSNNSVDANNADTLVLQQLDGAALSVAGQSTLICHRIADLSSPDVDEEGRKVYMVGGTYEIWTDQPSS
jgi:hypothetical protein